MALKALVARILRHRRESTRLQPPGVGNLQQGEGPSFKDYLLDSIKQVNTMQQDADKAVETLFTGGDVNPAEVLTAVQKADLAFRMMMQIQEQIGVGV